MSAETAEDSYHAPIGNAIANTKPEVGIVRNRDFLHHARITRIDFEITFVERFEGSEGQIALCETHAAQQHESQDENVFSHDW
jgi:hypothetical protein